MRLILVAVIASPTLAQHIVPPRAILSDRNGVAYAPFSYDRFRCQQIWTGTAIAPTLATITGISWRRDATDNVAIPAGHVIPRLDVRMGPGATTPATMSDVFKDNLAGPTTLLSSAALSLPAQAPVIGLAPFNLTIPFAQPFAFATPNRSLVLDMESLGRAASFRGYPLDAAYLARDGRVDNFGTPGMFPSGASPRMTYDQGAITGSPVWEIVPGGRFAMRVAALPGPHPTLITFGLSTTLTPASVLPVDLTPFGAPGNWLLSSIEGVLGPFTPSLYGLQFAVDHTIPIPNDPTLAGARWYDQGISLDPSANALGAVFSDGMEVVVGGRSTTTFTQMLFHLDSTSPTGEFGLTGRSPGIGRAPDSGGLVTGFSGTFN